MTVGGSSSSGAVVINYLQLVINTKVTTCFTLGGSPVGRSLTLDFGGNHQGHTVKIIATLNKSAQNEKTKTLQTDATYIENYKQTARSKSVGLGKADVFKLFQFICQ